MKSYVNDIEGYFCKWVIPNKINLRTIPQMVKVNVLVGSKIGNEVLYKQNILSFNINLASNIQIENKVKKGIELNRSKRKFEFPAISNKVIHLKVENKNDEDKVFEFVKARAQRSNETGKMNEYLITVIVPKEINHDFTATLILSNEDNKIERVPIKFSNKEVAGYFEIEERGEGVAGKSHFS